MMSNKTVPFLGRGRSGFTRRFHARGADKFGKSRYCGGLRLLCRQLNDELHIVGLAFRFMRRLVAPDGTAFCASVNDDKSLFAVRQCGNGLHKTAAVGGSVAGVYIEMNRPQAKRAVIPRGVAERLNLPAAMSADK